MFLRTFFLLLLADRCIAFTSARHFTPFATARGGGSFLAQNLPKESDASVVYSTETVVADPSEVRFIKRPDIELADKVFA
jgi:hypothetical protein